MAAEESPRPMATAISTHPPGAVDMKDYPLLVYGPRGDSKVRVASSGTSLEEIIAFREKYGEDLPSGSLARMFGLSEAEIDEIERWENDPQAPGR